MTFSLFPEFLATQVLEWLPPRIDSCNSLHELINNIVRRFITSPDAFLTHKINSEKFVDSVCPQTRVYVLCQARGKYPATVVGP